MNDVLSKFKLKIDEITFGLVPDSVEINGGKPVREVKGTDDGDFVVTQNVTDAFGKIKVEVYSTKENLRNASAVEERKIITATLWSEEDNYQVVMAKGTAVSGAENTTTGSDGKKVLEFHGSKLV